MHTYVAQCKLYVMAGNQGVQDTNSILYSYYFYLHEHQEKDYQTCATLRGDIDP